MSKLNLRLSYKNACILKHALRNQIEFQEGYLKHIRRILDTENKLEEYKKVLGETAEYTEENYSKKLKEHEEDKRALAAMEEAMVSATECHGRSWYKPSTK